jgi:hypothetical protein
MALDPILLADEITIAVGQSLPASTQIQGFASGLIDGMKSGVVSPAGIISGLSGSTISAAIAAGAGFPSVTPQLSGFGSSFATYVMLSGFVVPTPPVPPSGPILGLSGSAWAPLLAAASGFPSVSPQLQGFADAVMDHITNNAVVIVGVIT